MQEQVRRGMETMRMVWLIQRGHLFGWVPVALACGIGLYFGLRFEPGIKTFVAVGMLQALGLLLVRRAREEVQPLGWALLLVAIGFFLSVARAHTIAAPVLGERYYGSVQGTIVGVDRSASDALRLTLADVVLANRPEMLVPARVRISLHGDAGSFHPVPGQIILATAQLSPPGGPSETRGFDFRRHSWFQGLGAVGYTRVPIMVWRDADRIHGRHKNICDGWHWGCSSRCGKHDGHFSRLDRDGANQCGGDIGWCEIDSGYRIDT